jgi:hypothetical protein
MNCPDCGNPVEKDASFCPKCYARIEPPGLWQKFLRLFAASGSSRRSLITIRKTVSIKTTDKDGQHHEYRSLEEAPPELRAELEKLKSEVEKGASESLTPDPDRPALKFISKKTISLFKVRDASGTEPTYHSLDELPPEIRAAWEKAQGGREE